MNTIECKVCEHIVIVSEEDPDSSLEDALNHQGSAHRAIELTAIGNMAFVGISEVPC
ncbi:hypothetical protein SEA_EASTWEST_66 [Arthrobacter phage EastWest]|uniref:Uncharacterized protein n=1 Tax=Arthrobacter phage EastWest TaxID=2894292 RepID=A0AAE9C979_9CAUD|nr:hypothetical protein SEA_EASTWEST_66 [Arthrobacter phage EastWest]